MGSSNPHSSCHSALTGYLCLEDRKRRMERLALVHGSQVIRRTIKLLIPIYVTWSIPCTLPPQHFWVFSSDSWMASILQSVFLGGDFFGQQIGSLPQIRANVHTFLAFTKVGWMWPHPCSLLYVVIFGLLLFPFICLSVCPYNHNLTAPLSKHEEFERAHHVKNLT